MSDTTNPTSTEKMKAVKKGQVQLEERETTGTHTAVAIPETPLPETLTPTRKPVPAVSSPVVTSKPTKYTSSQPSKGKRKEEIQVLRSRCKQLGISVFFQGDTTVRSLGFTSAIAGEGKTFLARTTAEALAEDSNIPVVLVECNWENPTLSSTYHLSSGPGLADWLQGKCSLNAARRQVTENLTVISAGDSKYSETGLLRELLQRGVSSVLTDPDEVLILDLPSMVTTAYGPFAAQLADALILVVRMGVTPDSFVTEANHYLQGLPVHGVVLNQVTSRLPRWLRQIL